MACLSACTKLLIARCSFEATAVQLVFQQILPSFLISNSHASYRASPLQEDARTIPPWTRATTLTKMTSAAWSSTRKYLVSLNRPARWLLRQRQWRRGRPEPDRGRALGPEEAPRARASERVSLRLRQQVGASTSRRRGGLERGPGEVAIDSRGQAAPYCHSGCQGNQPEKDTQDGQGEKL